MSASQTNRSLVTATAQEVLPEFGQAFLIDDHETTWAITRNMEGPGLDTVRTGQRVQLTLDHHPDFSVGTITDLWRGLRKPSRRQPLDRGRQVAVCLRRGPRLNGSGSQCPDDQR